MNRSRGSAGSKQCVGGRIEQSPGSNITNISQPENRRNLAKTTQPLMITKRSGSPKVIFSKQRRLALPTALAWNRGRHQPAIFLSPSARELSYHSTVGIFLSTISGIGTVVVFGFLIRNLIKMPGEVATATNPGYMRFTYWTSHAVCLSCLVPWGVASFHTTDLEIWATTMMSPIVLTLIIAKVATRLMDKQSPEVRAYAEELAKNSAARRIRDSHKLDS